MADRPVALVTGSRTGLGLHLARHLLSGGWAVEGCSRQSSDLEGEAYTHHSVDVADERGVQELMRDIGRRHGALDAVVNNAGTASMNHALLMPDRTVAHILDVNVRGTFLVSREAARLMRRRGYGRIVNFTSVARPLNLEGEAAYAASKAAVETLTRVLAREFAPFGITVNAVGPGPVPTSLISGVPKEKIDALIRQLPIKRLTRPEDITNVVDFLLRKESDAVTGQVIYLGGVS